MENKKRVFVTGITGKQGAAVAAHLLKSGHEVMGLTRNANSEKAKNWNYQGVHIVEGDLNDAASFSNELNKADAIYLVQALQKKHSEIEQGKRFVDAVKTAKNQHLVYASVAGADLNTGIPHFDSKNEIEKHIKASAAVF